MHFALLPPEINSARIYKGPGIGPLLLAAQKWDEIAAELATASVAYESVTLNLAEMHWHGPASSSMLAAAIGFAQWLSATADLAAHSAQHAKLAAAAYEQARAASVAPALVELNRQTLAALRESNILGQNSAYMAALELEYAELWLRDALAMYTYAAASSSAATLEPFAEPPTTTRPGAISTQTSAVAQAAAVANGSTRALSVIPSLLDSVAAPVSVDGGSLLTYAEFAVNTISTQIDAAAFIGTAISTAAQLSPSAPLAESLQDGLAPFTHAVVAAVEGGRQIPGAGEISSSSVSAEIGQARMIGKLAVPPGWATPASASLNTSGGTAMALVPGTDGPAAVAPGALSVPGNYVKKSTSMEPRYGRKLTVMPRTPWMG
jgi:PPE-repeat protein